MQSDPTPWVPLPCSATCVHAHTTCSPTLTHGLLCRVRARTLIHTGNRETHRHRAGPITLETGWLLEEAIISKEALRTGRGAVSSTLSSSLPILFLVREPSRWSGNTRARTQPTNLHALFA